MFVRRIILDHHLMKLKGQKSRPFHNRLTITYNLPLGRNATLGKIEHFDKKMHWKKEHLYEKNA